MVGGVEVFGDWERAITVAIVRVVTGWRDDPIVPANVGEIHVQRMPLANVPAGAPVFPPFVAGPSVLLLLLAGR